MALSTVEFKSRRDSFMWKAVCKRVTMLRKWMLPSIIWHPLVCFCLEVVISFGINIFRYTVEVREMPVVEYRLGVGSNEWKRQKPLFAGLNLFWGQQERRGFGDDFDDSPLGLELLKEWSVSVFLMSSLTSLKNGYSS